jgi:hypothetical protein
MEPVEFDAGERAEIVAEAQRLYAEPPPTDRRGIGCMTVLGTGLLLLALPPLSKRLGWPPLIADILFWLLIIPCALGFFVAVFLTTSRYSRASARAHEALTWLATHPGTRDAEARRYAVALICYHSINDDGGLAQVVDVDEAKAKVGANLQYVVAVERVLAEEKLADVHFGRA